MLVVWCRYIFIDLFIAPLLRFINGAIHVARCTLNLISFLSNLSIRCPQYIFQWCHKATRLMVLYHFRSKFVSLRNNKFYRCETKQKRVFLESISLYERNGNNLHLSPVCSSFRFISFSSFLLRLPIHLLRPNSKTDACSY